MDPGDPLECLLGQPHSIAAMNGKVQQVWLEKGVFNRGLRQL